MQLDSSQARIKTLSLKERVGLFLAVCSVIYGAWDFVFYQPLIEKEKAVLSQKQTKSKELIALSVQLQKMTDSDKNSPELKRQRYYKSLLTQLTNADEQVLVMTEDLIKPEQMAGVIETLLIESEALSLNTLKGLGATPLMNKKPETEESKEIVAIQPLLDQATSDPDLLLAAANGIEAGVWRHGLTIEFNGSYLETLDYLKALEALPWTFFWDSIELDVEKFPRVNTAITVYTLSLDKSWIGV